MISILEEDQQCENLKLEQQLAGLIAIIIIVISEAGDVLSKQI